MMTNVMLTMKKTHYEGDRAAIYRLSKAIPRGFAASQQLMVDDSMVELFTGDMTGDVQDIADQVAQAFRDFDVPFESFRVSQYPNRVSRLMQGYRQEA